MSGWANYEAGMYEAQLERDADCHYGDHDWETNGRCRNCDEFNGGMLQFGRQEKAIREGRFHYGHFHLTVEAKAVCRRQPDAEWIEAYGRSEVPA